MKHCPALSGHVFLRAGFVLPRFSLRMKFVPYRINLFHSPCNNCPSVCRASGLPWLDAFQRRDLFNANKNGNLLAAPRGSRSVKFLAGIGTLKGDEFRKFYVPEFARDASFNKLNAADRTAFSSILADPQAQMLWVSVPSCADGWREEERTIQDQKDEERDKKAEKAVVANYITDWLGIYTSEAVEGSAAVVLLPHTTEEVQQILKYCTSRRLAVCIQAGNTGLVGGSVPVFDEVVLSLKKLNNILSFDAETGVLVAEAGCLIGEIEEFLENFSKSHPHTKRFVFNPKAAKATAAAASAAPISSTEAAEGEEKQTTYPAYIYPLDLASKSSCCVGGTVATAAGGNRYLRYGGAHKHVLGIEVITGDGCLLQHLNTHQKNNECLHLHHLFIGSEGVLGVITKVCIQCVPAPRSTTVTLLQIREPFAQVRNACIKAKENLSDILSALEFFDETSMGLTTSATGLAHPFASSRESNQQITSFFPRNQSNFYLLMETQGQCTTSDAERVEEFAEKLQEAGIIHDAVLAQTETQKADIWRLRDEIATSSSSTALKVLKFDVSLDVSKMYRPVELLNALLADGKLDGDFECLLSRGEALLQRQAQTASTQQSSLPATAIGYGHVGDGNVHINVLVHRSATAEEVNRIQKFCDVLIYGFVKQQQGSISAEHGIGILKAAHVPNLKGKEFMKILNRVKGCFDPAGILNPYKTWRGAAD